jgi:transposase-like protein
VQENIRNIRETLQLVLNLNDREIGSPVQNILYKAKLFRQLQNDLTSFSEVFQASTTEKMKIIASDRELKKKRQSEDNEEQLSLSFRDVV